MVMNLAENKIIFERNNTIAHNCYFSSDSSKLLSVTIDSTRLFNLKTGKQIWKNKLLAYRRLVVYDGNKIAFLANSSSNEFKPVLLIVDSATGKILYTVRLTKFNVSLLSWYHDSENHILIFLDDAKLQIIDIMTGKKIRKKKIIPLEKIYVSPDGKKIATLSREFITVENSLHGEQIFVWTFKTPLLNWQISSYMWSHNYLLIGVPDIYVFDISSGKIVWTEESQKYIKCCFSPDEKKLLLVKSEALICIDLYSRKELWKKPFEHDIDSVDCISNEIISINYHQESSIKVVFCNFQTGQKITDLETAMPILMSMQYFNQMKYIDEFGNYLVYHLIIGAPSHDNVDKLLFFDSIPLKIFTFLNDPRLSLDQAFLSCFIFESIRNNVPVVIPEAVKEDVYRSLPPEIQSLVDSYNSQEESKPRRSILSTLKKIKRSRKEKSQRKD